MEKIEHIRKEEKKYHDILYENCELFKPGTWLHAPVKTVIDSLDYFKDRNFLSILDLGCGVGRNSIPIAETLKHRNGRVVCVDFLDSALSKLAEYSKKYLVSQFIETKKLDVEDFTIYQGEYDFIVAVSVLEHLSSKDALERKLFEMVKGTKYNGVNCIVINTNIKETSLKMNTTLEPMFEVNMNTTDMFELLERIYREWKVNEKKVKNLQFEIERDGKPAILTTDCITFVATKSI